MKNTTRIITFLALAGIFASAVYIAIKPKPVPVDLAKIETGPMQVTINEEGVTRVRNIYQVFPPINGHLDRISLEEGDNVKAKVTVIGQIHPVDPPFLDQRTQAEMAASVDAARSAVKLAEVNLSRAEADAKLAEIELQRSLELQRNDFVSQAALDKKETEVLLKRAEVDRAKANISLRQAELKALEAKQAQPNALQSVSESESCCIEIMAPVSGTVLKIFNKSEQVVLSTNPIMEIGDPKDIEVAVDLLSSDAVKVIQGSKVIIGEWGGEIPLTGVVRRIDPAGFTKVSALGVEEQRVNVVLDLDTVPDSLGHGYRVFANFVVWSKDNVLQVPIGALFRKDGKWAVFVRDESRATIRQVKLGNMNDQNAEILEGLEQGLEVVLFPNDLLEDGSLVELRQ